MSLTHEDFNDYRMDIYDANALPTVSPTRTKRPFVPPVAHQPAEEFKRGIKRDKTHYISLKENKQWDDLRRSTLATAQSHGCKEVFNPKYKPKTTESKDLFIEKQTFIYSVFDECLLTDMGKVLVRSYEPTFDAQRI